VGLWYDARLPSVDFGDGWEQTAWANKRFSDENAGFENQGYLP